MPRVICEHCDEQVRVSVLNPDPECGECGGSEFTPPRAKN